MISIIILFIVVISVLVFVHELGHFLVAKKSGIRVDEFAVGFPPRIYSKKVGETTYSLGLIPVGGYVKIHGENPEENQVSDTDASRSIGAKSRWIQVAVLVAGVTFNVIFAWILFTVSYMIGFDRVPEAHLMQYATNSRVVIVNVASGTPAHRAGIKPGDAVLKVFNASTSKLYVEAPTASEQVRLSIQGSQGSPVGFEMLRNKEHIFLSTSPERNGERFVIGVELTEVARIRLPFYKAPIEAVKTTFYGIVRTVEGLAGFAAQAFKGDGDFSNISGPVGIARLVKDAASTGLSELFSFVAIISINLAVLNMVPFPALDGGRVVVVALEGLIRRPIKPVIINWINIVGFGLLMLLMLVITIKDILKVVR